MNIYLKKKKDPLIKIFFDIYNYEFIGRRNKRIRAFYITIAIAIATNYE